MAHDERRALWELKKVAWLVREISVGDSRMREGAIDGLLKVRREHLDDAMRLCEPFERLEKKLLRALGVLVLRSDPAERAALEAVLSELERLAPEKP